jgi:hypothetical protein
MDEDELEDVWKAEISLLSVTSGFSREVAENYTLLCY